jgi:hypothetical protein
MKKTTFALGLLLAAPMVMAEEELTAMPPPPELPPQVESGEVLEPEVTITESDRGTVHRYSINGKVYMVKVVPKSGPPYYFIDSDGDGQLDARADDIKEASVQQWEIMSW